LQIAASRAAAELGWKKAEAKILELNLDLERRVEQRTEELRAVNRELEAFSYSVSHDLRAPLRNISGFADLLKNNATGLSVEGTGYLATIAKEVRRMGALIDDLLEFSHISRTEMFMTTFDPAELVKEVRELLEIETGKRQISWHVEPLPQVKADRGLLRQVFANLMGNSIKYTGPREHATIHIGTLTEQPDTKDRVFFVRDNGVGFDMKYADKLFGVFQRLHSAKQFEGTGIGLANVQRIINRHGGSVWAEGTVNVGSTFYFSLPGPASNGKEK
jgi:light-regulated signal transduction histidine kinase (bacteriophytochrome)